MSRLLCLSVLLLLSFGSFFSSANAEQPNIIMILADDLGYGDLSCQGATDLQSPHIDQLLAGGVRLTNFYANSTVCSPTRAALMSGTYQDLVGVPGVIRDTLDNNWGWLSPDAKLLPAYLGDVGYHTALVGKWHLGLEQPQRPHDRGFDHFHGFLGDMMDDYYTHLRNGHNFMRKNDQVIDPKGHATDLFSDWACDYIEDRAQQKGQPFFLYLAYNAPHTPIQPPAEWLAKVQKREPQMTEKRAKLVALIEHMDAGIGQVMAKLDELQLTDNTLVIFSSDNGGQLGVGANNGPLRDGKGSMYEGGIKVACGARWPGVIPAGSTSNFQAMTMDLFATMLEAAGTDSPEELEGRSILPTLKGKPQTVLRESWFFRRREGGIRYGGKTIEAVHHKGWKLLQNAPFRPYELYHVAEDPLEKQDLSKANRKKMEEMTKLLRAQLQRYGSIPWQKPE